MARAPVTGSGRWPAWTASVLKPKTRSSSMAIVALSSSTQPLGSVMAGHPVVIPRRDVGGERGPLAQRRPHYAEALGPLRQPFQAVWRRVRVEPDHRPNSLKANRNLG